MADRTRGRSKVPESRQAFVEWASAGDKTRSKNFPAYVWQVAEARYVIRKVLRIADECARSHGLESLEHQALLQIVGSRGEPVVVNRIAERLDIAAALASRLVGQLAAHGLVVRRQSESDRRATVVEATPEGTERLRLIDEDVHTEVQYFQRKRSSDWRAALQIFAFYVGLTSDAPEPETAQRRRTRKSTDK